MTRWFEEGEEDMEAFRQPWARVESHHIQLNKAAGHIQEGEGEGEGDGGGSGGSDDES